MAYTDTEIVKDDSQLWVKAWLLDASLNRKKWGVTADSLPKYIKSFIGRPLTLYKTKHPKTGSVIWDHPWFANLSMDQNLQVQERWSIGRIKDITEKDGSYYAIINITDPMAAQTIRNYKTASLPMYVSPAIVHYPGDEQEDGILTKWEGGHLALVSDPAYDVLKTEIKQSCDGDAMTCMAKLKTASIECAGKLLEEYTSIMKNYENSFQYKMASEGNTTSANVSGSNGDTSTVTTVPATIQTTIPTNNNSTNSNVSPLSQLTSPNNNNNNNTNVNPPLNSGTQEKTDEQSQQYKSNDPWVAKEVEYNQKIAQLTSELEQTRNEKKTEAEKLHAEIEKINKRYELDQRRAQVQAVIPMDLFANANGRFNEEAYQAEVEKRTKSSWTLDEIAEYYQAKFERLQLSSSQSNHNQTRNYNNEESAEDLEVPQIPAARSRGRRASMTSDSNNGEVPQLDTASMTSSKKNSSLWFLELFDNSLNNNVGGV